MTNIITLFTIIYLKQDGKNIKKCLKNIQGISFSKIFPIKFFLSRSKKWFTGFLLCIWWEHRFITSCDLKYWALQMADSLFFFSYQTPLPSVGGKKWSFLCLTYCLSYINKLYDYPFFPNSFIFDATLLRYNIPLIW